MSDCYNQAVPFKLRDTNLIQLGKMSQLEQQLPGKHKSTTQKINRSNIILRNEVKRHSVPLWRKLQNGANGVKACTLRNYNLLLIRC